MGLMFHFTLHGWLAFIITDSEFWVGAVYGMGGLGMVASSIGSGVLVDRLNRKVLIIATQLMQASVFGSIAALIFSDEIQLWHVMLSGLLNGTLSAIKIPSRAALTLDVAGRPNMMQASAADFAALTGAGIVIPLVAGWVVNTHGMDWAYVGMTSAFLTSTAVLAFLKGVQKRSRSAPSSPKQDFTEGMRFIFSTPAVRTLILIMLTSEAFGWAHESMLPVMAGKVLNAGSTGLSYLLSAANVGALLSAIGLSLVGDIRNKGLALIVAYIGFGVFLILFALSPWLPLSMVLIAMTYSLVAIYEPILGTLLQTSVPDEMRGRVLSFQTLTWGVTGLSGFHTGAIAALWGAPVAISIGGGVLVLNGLRLIREFSRRYIVEAQEANKDE